MSRLRWWLYGGGALVAVVLLLVVGYRMGRPEPLPPPTPPPTLADRPDGPQAPTEGLTLVVQAVLAQQTEMLRLMQARQGGDGGAGARSAVQAEQMQALLLGLLNDQRRQRGEALLAPTATASEVSEALAAQGGVVLPERVVTAPCGTRGRMHGVIPASGAEWELIPEWDPCPPAVERRPWLDFSSGTLYSLKLAGAAWGNANVTLAEEIAGASLSLDSTRIGWYAGGEVEHLWISRTGRYWHGLGVEGGYQHSTAGAGWTARLYYQPSLFVPSKR